MYICVLCVCVCVCLLACVCGYPVRKDKEGTVCCPPAGILLWVCCLTFRFCLQIGAGRAIETTNPSPSCPKDQSKYSIFDICFGSSGYPCNFCSSGYLCHCIVPSICATWLRITVPLVPAICTMALAICGTSSSYLRH